MSETSIKRKASWKQWLHFMTGDRKKESDCAVRCRARWEARSERSGESRLRRTGTSCERRRWNPGDPQSGGQHRDARRRCVAVGPGDVGHFRRETKFDGRLTTPGKASLRSTGLVVASCSPDSSCLPVTVNDHAHVRRSGSARMGGVTVRPAALPSFVTRGPVVSRRDDRAPPGEHGYGRQVAQVVEFLDDLEGPASAERVCTMSPCRCQADGV